MGRTIGRQMKVKTTKLIVDMGKVAMEQLMVQAMLRLLKKVPGMVQGMAAGISSSNNNNHNSRGHIGRQGPVGSEGTILCPML